MDSHPTSVFSGLSLEFFRWFHLFPISPIQTLQPSDKLPFLKNPHELHSISPVSLALFGFSSDFFEFSSALSSFSSLSFSVNLLCRSKTRISGFSLAIFANLLYFLSFPLIFSFSILRQSIKFLRLSFSSSEFLSSFCASTLLSFSSSHFCFPSL